MTNNHADEAAAKRLSFFEKLERIVSSATKFGVSDIHKILHFGNQWAPSFESALRRRPRRGKNDWYRLDNMEPVTLLDEEVALQAVTGVSAEIAFS